ncbi:hypothetical protein SNEBB_010073 [Seison nebaliae]|nr:hypothetical protein SNEBB_010073 [Seison nebaliae]
MLSLIRISLSIFVLQQVMVELVSGHGHLINPGARNSCYRQSKSCVANYDINSQYCGGVSTQWSKNGGKCGLCGDPYNAPVKAHEPGGKFYTGTIMGTYKSGSWVPIQFVLSANHLGWVDFKVCPTTDGKASQNCLDNNLLIIKGHSKRLDIVSGMRDLSVEVRLPIGLVCDTCMLQWRYRAGNSWGTDPVTGQSGKGYGAQETFVNCADIKIEA